MKKLTLIEFQHFELLLKRKNKRELDLFDNHCEVHKIFKYLDPQIQYKIRNKKPSIPCLSVATGNEVI